ncbi:IS3 family transposase [Candidatus Woesearchaeota archaeon]|nr:IS3 family transposase [Candidatus Woesearchaeota archaeon]
MLYEQIKAEERLCIDAACSALEVSRHAYKNWVKSPELQPDEITPEVVRIAEEFPAYGYRKITKQLQIENREVNHKRILGIMRINHLTVKIKHFRHCTTDSNHGLRTYPNLIKEVKVVKLNQVWVSDITYIKLATSKMVYLATVMDRFSRRFLGWEISENIDALLCINALHMAFKEREGMSLLGLIHHSDRGSQYASNEYVHELEIRGIQISMSRKGNPYDNAYAESGFKTIKYEEVYMNEYYTISEARENIQRFIEEVYNKKRLHSSIGYKPPAEFERAILKEVTA